MNLILVELNEINFDVVRSYIDRGEDLPSFKKIIDSGMIETRAESEYEKLEPWIQWPSVHLGKSFEEHGIFRLGDIVHSDVPQFFEQIEQAGYSVGAISPMNAQNRLKKPAYFIPDPWTSTSTDGSFFSEVLSSAVSQAVNDNAQSKLSLKTIFSLILTFFAKVRPQKIPKMIWYAFTAIGKPWRKAMFLDTFLHEVHMTEHAKASPDFSTIFFNGGAHIQHHYFFNSSALDNRLVKNPDWYIKDHFDPILEMLEGYDDVLGDILDLEDTELILATGLSQKPYDRLKIYYRLKNHGEFLNILGIPFKDIQPRMTRDFLVTFDSASEATDAEQRLAEIVVDDDTALFGEIDNRGTELFVTLTYPNEAFDTTSIVVDGKRLKLKEHLAFVAVKNGMHQSTGFAYFSDGIRNLMPENGAHVSNINTSVIEFFGVNT